MEEKFEKDFKELRELNLKKKELLESLNKEFEIKCNSFLKKYNIRSKFNINIGIENLLNKDLSYAKLLELLNLKIGSLAYINSLKDHMNKTKIEPKFLDYNLSYIKDLEYKFQSLDSIENTNSNDLFAENGYMIDYELENLLKFAQHRDFKYDNNDYVYLVVFNKIKNKGRNVLVYNYIAYNKIFLKLLYIFLEFEQLFSINLNSISKDLFFIIDSSLMKECNNIKSNYNFNENIIYQDEVFNFIHLLKSVVKGRLIDFNYEDMGKLIPPLNQQDEINILNKLTNEINIDYRAEGYLFNYISRFLFLVSDLDLFIKSVRDNIDVDVNQGPQKDRGSINYISHTLIHLDKAFRDSLYNHNRKYIKSEINNNYVYDRYIPRSCFSFRNIHINIGKVKW
nr:hypothetical protein [Cordyceps militaris]